MRGQILFRQRGKGKGSYYVKVSLKDPASGKYRQHWEAVKGSKRDAEKRLSEILHQLDTGTYMKSGKTTMADYLNRWLADYVKPNLSPRGFERYESITRVHLIPALGGIQLTLLRPEHLQKHYTAMLGKGLSPRSIRYHHVILHKALATAMKWGLVSRNAADGVDVPRAQRTEMQTWDEHELHTFLETARSTQYYTLFYTALFTGARRSELLALRWQDIDFIYGQISINRSLHHVKGAYIFTQPKTDKSRRTIALPPSAFLVLSEYRKVKEAECLMLGTSLKDSDMVFSILGKPLRPNTVTRAWGMLAAKAGVKVIRLHDARHTHASLMLKQGIHPKIVQERLGHSTIAITLDTYSHVAPGLQEAAAKRFDDAVQVKDNNRVNQVLK
jgi:integrase